MRKLNIIIEDNLRSSDPTLEGIRNHLQLCEDGVGLGEYVMGLGREPIDMVFLLRRAAQHIQEKCGLGVGQGRRIATYTEE